MSTPHLPATPKTTRWGTLPAESDPPVLTVDPGEQLTIDTVSHEGILEDQGRDPVAFFGRHGVAPGDVLADAIDIAANGDHDPLGPHVITGPVAVRGAQPGDWLAVRVDALRPRAGYGVISSRHGRGALPGRFPAGGAPVTSIFCRVDAGHGYLPLSGDAGRDGGPGQARFPLGPFLGIMGVTPAGTTRRGSVAPGEFGGNLDIALLRAGSVLYLPVEVPGAGFYVGDPHYAQGNGEIALTALEAPLTATLTVGLVERAAAGACLGDVTGPVAATPEYLVPTGLDADLDVALERCAANAVELLRAAFGMEPELGYAYLSAAADFDISQVVDLVKGVHARIRRADFPQSRAPFPGGWSRISSGPDGATRTRGVPVFRLGD
ncbi:MAG TPA: acetamidase/formamidase family protein [Trebonia sp.]|nr:acetamidase/formamidase family protein [Trebonia sp.]